MTNDLHPYREYKESGLPWLGKVPSHWRLVTLRRVAKVQLSNVDKHTLEGEDPIRLCNYTDVYHHRYIRPDLRFMKATALPREIEKFELQGGDVLITKDSEDWKDIAVPALVTENMPGVLCGYHLAHIRPGEELYGEYLMWACRSESVALQFRTAANGVTRYGVSGPDIKAGLLPLPPIAEQKAIGFYLREIEQRVNRFIRNRRRLIEVLNEQKQAIINRAVTRGLDSNVRFKSSGIDWQGDIPEHWEITTLGRLVKSFKTGPFGSILHQSDYTPGGIPVVNPLHMSNGSIKPDYNCAVDQAIFERLHEYALQHGDIVFSRRGELGRCALVREDQAGWLLGTGSIRARLVHNAIDTDYLLAALQCRWVADHLSLMSVGATMQSLNTGILRRLPVPLPPHDEQLRIPKFVERETAQVNEAITRVQRQIDLIREYRTRLITDVVTGKLDVRHLGQDMVGEFHEPVDVDEDIDEEQLLGDEEPELGEGGL